MTSDRLPKYWKLHYENSSLDEIIVTKEYKLRIDPIKLSIIQHRLDMVIEEMATTMLRTARSTVAASAKDYAVCVFDSKGWLVALKESLPAILWGLGLATHAADKWPCEVDYEGTEDIGAS